MRALIVDDERLARVEMRRLLAAHPAIMIAGEAGNGNDALEAMSALEREKLFPALRVKLSVEHGWLTLSGDAAHRVERSAAECVVRYVPGVKGVTNRLVVTMAERR